MRGIVVMCAALAVSAATAEERPVPLAPALGLDKVEAHCGACHSLDYVRMNAPFLTAAGWDAEVTKMINAFGAPIGPADARIIADYLTTNYGLAPKRTDVAPSETRGLRETPSARTIVRPTHSKNLGQRSAGPASKLTTRAARHKHVFRSPAYAAARAGRRGTYPASTLLRWARGTSIQLFKRPRYAVRTQCWTDEGYGRWTPCGGAGGNSGSGGD